MINKAIWWAIGGLVACSAFSVSVAWALIITVVTAIAAAL